MSSNHITEGAEMAELNQDRSLGVSAHGHAGLEQDIWTCLGCRLGLRIIVSVRILRPKVRHLVGRQEHDYRLGIGEGRVEHRADVRRGLASHLNRLFPLDWLEAQGTQEGKHAVPSSQVPAVHNKDLPGVRAFYLRLDHDAPSVSACIERVFGDARRS